MRSEVITGAGREATVDTVDITPLRSPAYLTRRRERRFLCCIVKKLILSFLALLGKLKYKIVQHSSHRTANAINNATG